jgi:hypothetical protein
MRRDERRPREDPGASGGEDSDTGATRGCWDCSLMGKPRGIGFVDSNVVGWCGFREIAARG